MLKILLTNDDGIHADGLLALFSKLKNIADVTIVAPDRERSSISQAITLKDPIRYKKIKINKTHYGYAVTGTPTDCVKIGLKVICDNFIPDLIVSGINHGNNDGCSVHYSGTVAAAREGALNQIPSIALSLNTFNAVDFTESAEISARLIKRLAVTKLKKNVFLNVNIPHLSKNEIKGTKIVKQSCVPIHSRFQKKTDQYGHDYYWLGAHSNKKRYTRDADSYYLNKGYITIVPVKTDTTDFETLENLSNFRFNS